MLKLNVRVGDSVAIGGPTTMRIDSKSGQAVGLVFDAPRDVPIRIVPATEQSGAPKPHRAPVGLGLDTDAAKPAYAHDVPGLQRRQSQ